MMVTPVQESPPDAPASDKVSDDELRAKLEVFGAVLSNMVSSIFAENLGPNLEAQRPNSWKTAQLFDGRSQAQLKDMDARFSALVAMKWHLLCDGIADLRRDDHDLTARLVELEDALPAYWLDQLQQQQMHPDPAAPDLAVVIGCRVKLPGLQIESVNGTLGTISSCDAVAGTFGMALD